MANFYATYSAAAAAGASVSATQGTSPWIVAGGGTAGSAATGVVTIQGIASGVAVPISGSITATNASVSATGAAVPASATMVGGTDGTNLRALKTSSTGVVSVDGSAVTQPVSGSGTFTTDQVATTSATFQDGAIAFGSLTTNYQTVITTGGALKNVSMRNNTNAVLVVSLNAGSTTSYTLDSGDAVSLDLKTLGLNIPTSTALQAKVSGTLPTSGSIRINGVY